MEEHDVPYVETREAANQLGLSFRELYRLVDAGDLPAYKVDRDIKLRQSDIDTFRLGRSAGA